MQSNPFGEIETLRRKLERVERALPLATGGGGTPEVTQAELDAVAYPQVVTVNTPTTIASGDKVVLVTGSVTVTLPASPTTGQVHDVKDAAGTAGSGAITIAGNGRNIDGASTASITTNYGALRIVASATAWYLI